MHSGKEVYSNIIFCHQCGFMHRNPVPVLDPEEFFDSHRDYAEHQQDEWTLNCDVDILRNLESGNGGTGKLLDVGCGPGVFAERAIARGWEVYGIEPSVYAARQAMQRGVVIVNEPVPVDVVVFKQSAEHIHDFCDLLFRCQSALKPQGLIWIEVANDFNPLQLAYIEKSKKPMWWVVKEHVNYFQPETIKSLLIRCGFTVESMTTTFPLELFLLMGDEYVGNPDLGKRCHLKRVRFENSFQSRGLYQSFCSQGCGREIQITGRKN